MGSFVFIISVFAVIQTLNYYGKKTKLHRLYSSTCQPPRIEKTDIFFKGSQSGINKADIHRILAKRYHYYRDLQPELQELFAKRLQSFMRTKLFIVKDDEGFKEMPVLVSAAAIQLTFGLKHYRLPFYKYIRIYPEEYFGDHSFNVLAGTVQGNSITVAWNHLLKGNEHPTDGSNVGLHEMSHALYIQKMVIEENYAKQFSSRYNYLITECKEAYSLEIEGKKDLYSNYANTNLQEFWAESVEIFFEKPKELNEFYPNVFEAMKWLLNQNPLDKENPLLQSNLSFAEKMETLRKVFRKRKQTANHYA